MTQPWKGRARNRSVLLVLLAFSLLGITRHLHMIGEDLASSYVGCRLIAAGESSHLYSRSAAVFTDTEDPEWDRVALQSGFTSLNLLHPYVQAPLWAWSLQPVCTRVTFRVFCDGFVVLLMLCTSVMLWLVARFWTPALFHPGWMVLVCAVLYVSEPFKYALFLAQTHVLFILLSVVALMLAERQRSFPAGFVLALAALVKITPGLLCVYWIVTRRWKATAWFAASFACLFGLGIVLMGAPLTRAYLHSLSENSNVLLVAFNNQSFAAWWMGYRFPRVEVYKWIIYPLPSVLKACSSLLGVGCAIIGGILDRPKQSGEHPDGPPYGAVFAMVAATLFATIAWTHYYILLIVPAMMLLQKSRKERSRVWMAALSIVFVLNLYPISFGAVHLYHRRISIVRSQFYSGLLMMGTLVALRRKDPIRIVGLPL